MRPLALCGIFGPLSLPLPTHAMTQTSPARNSISTRYLISDRTRGVGRGALAMDASRRLAKKMLVCFFAVAVGFKRVLEPRSAGFVPILKYYRPLELGEMGSIFQSETFGFSEAAKWAQS